MQQAIGSWVREASILKARAEAAEAELASALNNLCAYNDSAPVARGFMFSQSEHHTRASQLAAQLVACKRCPQRWLQTVTEEVDRHIAHDEEQLTLIGDTHREAVMLIALTENMIANEEAEQMAEFERNINRAQTASVLSVATRARAQSQVRSSGKVDSKFEEKQDLPVMAPKPSIPKQQLKVPIKPRSNAPPDDAVTSFTKFMAKYNNQTSLGWSDEDHAVFLRCFLNGSHGNKAILPGPPLQDRTNTINQSMNAPLSHLSEGKPAGAVPLPYGVLVNTASNYCAPRMAEVTAAGHQEGLSAVEACLAKLPHMTLQDISEHITAYENYVQLVQRRHDAIDTFKAQRTADKKEAEAIEVFRNEQEAMHEQLAAVAKERTRLLRHQHNKRLVEGWRANKAASIQHTAEQVLEAEELKALHNTVTPVFSSQREGEEQPLYLASHSQEVAHKDFLNLTDPSAPQTFLSSHPTLDELSMAALRDRFRNATNEVTLQQLLHDYKDAERRQAATQRIQRRQAEIKGGVKEYKEAKEAAARQKHREEIEFLQSKGYPVPPQGYRASSSFASSSAPRGSGATARQGRVGDTSGHYDPYNLHSIGGASGGDDSWYNVPQHRAQSASTRPPSSAEAPESMKKTWARDEEMVRRRQELTALKEAKLSARANAPVAKPALTRPIVRDVGRLSQPTQSARSRSEASAALRNGIGGDGSRLKGFTAVGSHTHLGSVGWAGGIAR